MHRTQQCRTAVWCTHRVIQKYSGVSIGFEEQFTKSRPENLHQFETSCTPILAQKESRLRLLGACKAPSTPPNSGYERTFRRYGHLHGQPPHVYQPTSSQEPTICSWGRFFPYRHANMRSCMDLPFSNSRCRCDAGMLQQQLAFRLRVCTLGVDHQLKFEVLIVRPCQTQAVVSLVFNLRASKRALCSDES
jgi:hypothetical protein